MNNGDSNEPLETWIDPNLEVRILSMILGEASEFEQAELQKEILENSEIKAFYQRMLEIHELLENVNISSDGVASNDWKLNSERRSQLLDIFNGDENTESSHLEETGENYYDESKKLIRFPFKILLISSAAIVLFSLFSIALLKSIFPLIEEKSLFESVGQSLDIQNQSGRYYTNTNSATAEKSNLQLAAKLSPDSLISDYESSLDLSNAQQNSSNFEKKEYGEQLAERTNIQSQRIENEVITEATTSNNSIDAIEEKPDTKSPPPPAEVDAFADSDPFSASEEIAEAGAFSNDDPFSVGGDEGQFSNESIDQIQTGETNESAKGKTEFLRSKKRSKQSPTRELAQFRELEELRKTEELLDSNGIVAKISEDEEFEGLEFDQRSSGEKPENLSETRSRFFSHNGQVQAPGHSQNFTIPQQDIDSDGINAGYITGGIFRGRDIGGAGFGGGGIKEDLKNNRWFDETEKSAQLQSTFPVTPINPNKPSENEEPQVTFGFAGKVIDSIGNGITAPTDRFSGNTISETNLGRLAQGQEQQQGAGQKQKELGDKFKSSPSPSRARVDASGKFEKKLDKSDIEVARNSKESSFKDIDKSIPKSGTSILSDSKNDKLHIRSQLLRQADEAWETQVPNLTLKIEQKGLNKQLLEDTRNPITISGRSTDTNNLAENQQNIINQGLSLSRPARKKIDLSQEKIVRSDPFSTFSLHVSDVSFKLSKSSLLDNNQWPENDKIRPEEFINAFDYGDPPATIKEKISCRIEQCIHPFLQQRNLLKISMKTAATGRSISKPLSLTVLLDKSGSMERQDREFSLLKSMEALSSHLNKIDVVTLIGFARQPRLIGDRIPGNQSSELLKLVKQTPSEGGTNLEEALNLAHKLAKRQYVKDGINRIVLITDGAANLGDADAESLRNSVIAMRQEGIAFDACGVGADGINDKILESLTRKGDGRYYFLNKPEDADDNFVRQLAGSLRPAAKNVKVQVKFNPKRVISYKLTGFEKHRLEKEDFRNDAVDAAEMTAAEAGVALYHFQANPEGIGPVGEVSVRFKDMVTGKMMERKWNIPYDNNAPRLRESTSTMQLAALSGMFAEKLKASPIGEAFILEEINSLSSNLRSHFKNNERVSDLIQMIQTASNLSN
ncbi:MAG: von Willebrand factor type A domain-containing protein [Verrucomicrobiales bacterium]